MPLTNILYTSAANPITCLADVFNRPYSKISWLYATTHEIEKIIKLLETKNTSGYDEIHSRILKLSTPFIISPLTYTVKPVLNGISRDQKIFRLKPGFRLIMAYYIVYCNN
jgi:hypothetical protein